MPAQRRSGFTLIELMVAVVISGILVTTILQLLRSQGQFARVQTAREEAQQNARAAVDLIAAELRGIGWGGISDGEGDEITFHSPTAWGVVCATSGNRVTVLYSPDVVPTLNSPADGMALVDSNGNQHFVQVADVTEETGLPTQTTTCASTLQPSPVPVAPSNRRDSRVRIYQGSIPAGVAAGTRVYRYATVTYEVVNFDGRPWIFRNEQQFAGPLVASGEGLRFRYLAADGATAADPASARSIGVSVTTRSRGSVNETAQTDRASTVVFLRNRS